MGWLIALGILTLIAILPIGVSAIYDEDGPRASIIAGPVRIPVFPLKKKEKKVKGTALQEDIKLDIPEDEIWTYKIDGLAEPHINKPFTNFTLKKVVFTVLLVIAVAISMYFSVRVVSRTPFEYNETGDGTYEFTKFNNTGYIRELTIDYAVTIETDKDNPDAATNFTLVKDETKPITSIPQFCFNCDENVETIYVE